MTIKNFSVKNGLTAGNITLNATTNAITTSGNITVGNANLGNLVTANFFQGDGGLLTNISTTGGSAITNGNSNVSVSENSNITVSVSGNTNIAVFSGTGINIAGYTTITGNLTAANANLGNLVIANYFTGSGNNLSNIQGANVLGQVSNALIAGTVYTNAQPNITSVGTLSTVSVTGNATAGNVSTGNLTVSAISNLGPASNVIITGGTANYVLSTDGAGNLSWVAAAPGSSATIETFTGNGVQTTFTLSSAPANVNLVTVNYNGAIVFHESFTLSGANVTFGSAPANGSKLEITTLVPSISGGGGASDARAMGYSLVFGG